MPAVSDALTGAPWRPPPPKSPLGGLLRRLIRRLARAGIVGVAALLTVVPLVVLVAVTQNQAERTVKAEARQAAQSSARAGANVVSAEVRGLEDVVRAYAQRRLLQRQLHESGAGAEGVRRHLRELSGARPGISAAWALKPDGRLVDIVPATPEIVGRSFAFRDYYRGVTRSRRTYVSESFVVASRNHPLSVAVADLVPAPDGGPAGILAAGYDLAAIQRFVTRYAAAERIALTVTDQSGTVVAGPGGPRRQLRSLRDDPLVAAALAGRTGFARRDSASGAVLAASAPVGGLGWTVTAEVEETRALAGVAGLRQTQLMLGIPLGIGLLAGIAVLGVTLRRRARAEEALRLSEERALGIVRTSPDAFVALDESGRITAWNPAAERMFGWSEAEVLGRPLTETIVPPAFRDRHSAGMERFIRTREPRVIGQSLELPALRRDGSEMPMEIAISASDRPDGMAIHAFIRDISKRKRDEEELREAHAQAVESSRLKSEFVANMSHELRTPLNGVIGMNDLLLQTRLEPEQREYASMARRAGEALLSLISDILDFSKIEAGRLELDEIDFDVRGVVDDACAIVAETAFSKGLELLPWVDPAVPARVRGDDVRLRQVLINLVGNAIKFTDSGEVVVRVAVNGDRLRFEVSDTGIGIAPEQQERLWEAFTQADSSTTRNFGGTGLGLTISRRLVEAMDGTIRVESTPGAGSTFHVELPLRRAAATGAEHSSRPESADALAGRRILVVDDNATNRAILEGQLSGCGMSVTVAADGHRALEILRDAREPFDLALLDFDMPGLDGIQLAAAIRADAAIPPIVLALLTSGGGERAAARQADFRLHLTKPVRQETLRAALTRALSDLPVSDESPAVPEPAPVASATILVAEDNPVNQVVARATLEKLGFRVDIASDGERAVAMSADGEYAAIFMDCQMPRLDGYSATAAIRAREAGSGRHVPIVAMTAHALKGDRERCLQAGMDDYLTKPLERGELHRVLAEWVSGAAARPGGASAVAARADGSAATADESPSPQIADEGSPGLDAEEGSSGPDADEASSGPDADEASSSPTADDWLDPEAAARLRAEHSAATLRSLAALFEREAPARLADLSEAARRRDPEPLWEAAHRLKSSCRIVGAVGMERLCAELEDHGRAGRLDVAGHLVARLEAAYRPVAAALQRQLD